MLRLIALPLAGVAALALAAGPAPTQASVFRPVAGAVVTQGFGCTELELEPEAAACPGGHFHSGIDLAAPLGTPVRAAAGGVARVVDSPTSYGLHVLVNTADGAVHLYGHLDTVAVRTGESVAAGRPLGRLGSSGLSTGPHLHFEVRRGGRPEDPAALLAAAR